MMLWEAFALALRAVRRNMMRSALTMLGIVIGVAAVIAMVTLGNGTTARVTASIQSLGSNVLIVTPGAQAGRGPGGAAVAGPAFTLRDATAISQNVGDVTAVAPMATARGQVVSGNENWPTTITGTTNDYLIVRQWTLAIGRPFTDAEIRAGRAVCFLGETVRKEIFGAQDPLGASIRVRDVACEIVGVLASKGQAMGGTDQDDVVILPLRAVQRRMNGNDDVMGIQIAVGSSAMTTRVAADVTALLRERRHIVGAKEDDFRVLNIAEIANTVESTTHVLTAFLSALAAVSLVVGGIGIMNIMLVSVTERTREIGIRLAIGALERDVLAQFLVEAVVLSLCGGCLEGQLRDLELGSRPQELDDHEQTVIAARRSLDDAELDLRRMQALIVRGAISQQTLDKTQLARDVAATKYAQAQAALSLAREGTRRQQVSASRASLAAARSQLVSLVATIPSYFIRSPWTGVVTDRAHEPGEAVSPGTPILTVTNPGDRWVRIYIPENQIGAVGLGQRATITSDAFPNRPLAGHVRWISDEAEFTPRNVETKDDRVRLVYAAKIQIDGDSAMVLKPGTPADVRITLARAPTP